jgi:hypothetical protein
MASSTSVTAISRRSFSLPATRAVSTPDPQVEILYTLPSARIVSFTTSNQTFRPSSSNESPAAEVETGTLPWISRFERTIAVGMYLFLRFIAGT